MTKRMQINPLLSGNLEFNGVSTIPLSNTGNFGMMCNLIYMLKNLLV